MKTADLLKLFGESATDLLSRYRTDIFFRTKWNVILLQIGFGLGAIALFWVTLQAAQHNIAAAIAGGFADIVNTDGVITAERVLERISEARQYEFLKLFGIALFAALFFGYFVSRATLSPAKQALTSQKRFISNIAHELRTPLSVIKTNSEVMLLDDALPQDTRQSLTENIEEVDRASEIINNLLSLDGYLSRQQLQFKEVDFGRVVDNAIKQTRPLALNRQQDLTVRKRGEYRQVIGNETALEQVVINLIRNAIAHTPVKGSVLVSVEPDYQGFIELEVRDTGSGIARKDLYHIFEPYYRGIESRTRGKGGSGLGLTIVSEIVKSHQGKISVKTAVDKGTTVTVKIPCPIPQQAPAGLTEEPENDARDEVAMDFTQSRRL